jgi:hypothetical protein
MQVRGRFSRQDLTPRIPLALKMTAWLRVSAIDQPSFRNDMFHLFLFQAERRETIIDGEASRSLR